MANLDIFIDVKGEEKLKSLGRTTESISTKTVALGNVYAKLAEVAVEAVTAIVDAGADHLKAQEELNSHIIKTTELENALSESFGMASASILEQTGLWEAYRETLVDVSNLLDAVAGKEAIKKKAIADSNKMEEERQAMLVEDAKWKEEADAKELRRIKALDAEKDRLHRKELARKKAEIDADVRQQKNLSRIEAIVAKEHEEAMKRAKEKEEAYEAELKALDQWVDDVNKATDAQIALSQAVDTSTQSIAQNTEAKESNSSASAQNGHLAGGGMTFSSTQPVVSGAEAYMYATGMMQNPYNREESGMIKYLKSIDRNTRNTNRKLS